MDILKQILHKNLLLEAEKQENIKLDKYGDEVKIIKNWAGFNIPDKQYKTLVKDYFTDILMRENGISEKNFTGVDEMINKTRQFFNVNKKALDELIKDSEENKQRVEYIAEKIYNEFYKKNTTRKSLNENKYVDSALDKIKSVGGFEKLPDIDKLALLTNTNDVNKLKRLSLLKIYRELGGTFGMFMVKVRVKDINKQPIDHKFSKELAGKEGWLYPTLHNSDENDLYVTVRFGEFTSDMEMKGGGTYAEYPIMLDNMYPIGYEDIKSDFVKYRNKIDMERMDTDLFEHIIKANLLNEAKKSKFQKLKDNKVPLTDEERDKVMKADAVWHHGKNGEATPAVWKSKDKNGDITYVTNTHRAVNTAKSLQACINKYHNFIKGTA